MIPKCCLLHLIQRTEHFKQNMLSSFKIYIFLPEKEVE